MISQIGIMSLDIEDTIEEPENIQDSEIPELHEDHEALPSANAHGDKEHPPSPKYEALLQAIGLQESVDMKLQIVMDFMEETLSQSGIPQFKNFWEARKLCIDFFKENLSPGVRAHLWSKYGELTKQARALKEILDEQTSFAVEQIEIAINALEEEVSRFDHPTHREPPIDPEKAPAAFSKKLDLYGRIQQELNLTNAAAARINSLRKELIKTEMRIRQKNKFFQRLSSVGDKVFPRRKELIKQISQEFQGDVDNFIKIHFENEDNSDTLFALRDEIKKLQSFAKFLTLNTQSFTSTRLKLSTCWDKIKVKEKEWKKVKAQAKAVHKENAEPLLEKIRLLEEEFKNNGLTLDQASKKGDEIAAEMRQVELGKDEVYLLKEALNTIRKEVQNKRKEEDDARQAQHRLLEEQRKQVFAGIKAELDSLIREAPDCDANQFVGKSDALREKVRGLALNKAQRMELDPLFRSIGDLVTEKKENYLLNLPEDDRNAIEDCKELLQQRNQRRREIKEQLDTLRKAAGVSGLDFEQAISYNQQLESEKLRLEKANQAIQEIEAKLAALICKQ